MPRLESIAKAGYFPTPPEVVERVVALIETGAVGGQKAVRLIDPCCGTGAALRQLADQTGGETYGIEIAAERYEAARSQLDHTLHASGLTARIANEAFSCLFLNPPYDYDDESKRLEHGFLTETSRVLSPGGLLVFIVPQRRLAVSARYLAGHFSRLTCYRFPDPEFAAFSQVVVLAVKRESAVNDALSREQVVTWSGTDDLQVLPATNETAPALSLPALSPKPVLFSSLFFDPEAAAVEARQHGVWTSPLVTERLWPAEERPIRPLMPLRRGHLAVLMAAGFLNNLLLEGNSRRLLVKGRTYKELVEVASDDPEVKVEREVLRTSVVTLDLDTAQFEVVQQAGAAETSNLPNAA
jgi:SAM-dependent methyltransferase